MVSNGMQKRAKLDTDRVTVEMTRETRTQFHLKYIELGYHSYEDCIRKEILGLDT